MVPLARAASAASRLMRASSPFGGLTIFGLTLSRSWGYFRARSATLPFT